MDVIVEGACGLDVHQKTVVACIRVTASGRKPVKEIKTFGTTLSDLEELRGWLHARGVTRPSAGGLNRQGTILFQATSMGGGPPTPIAGKWRRVGDVLHQRGVEAASRSGMVWWRNPVAQRDPRPWEALPFVGPARGGKDAKQHLKSALGAAAEAPFGGPRWT